MLNKGHTRTNTPHKVTIGYIPYARNNEEQTLRPCKTPSSQTSSPRRAFNKKVGRKLNEPSKGEEIKKFIHHLTALNESIKTFRRNRAVGLTDRSEKGRVYRSNNISKKQQLTNFLSILLQRPTPKRTREGSKKDIIIHKKSSHKHIFLKNALPKSPNQSISQSRNSRAASLVHYDETTGGTTKHSQRKLIFSQRRVSVEPIANPTTINLFKPKEEKHVCDACYQANSPEDEDSNHHKKRCNIKILEFPILIKKKR